MIPVPVKVGRSTRNAVWEGPPQRSRNLLARPLGIAPASPASRGLALAVGADVDGDGSLDLVHAAVGGTVSVMRGLDDGTVDSAETYMTSDRIEALSVEDLDGDGNADVVVQYRDGRKKVQTEDRDLNGAVDVVTHFGVDEKPEKIEEDSDGDGVLRRSSLWHLNGGVMSPSLPLAIAFKTSATATASRARASAWAQSAEMIPLSTSPIPADAISALPA